MGHERGITDIVDDHTINRAESLDKLGAMLGVSAVRSTTSVSPSVSATSTPLTIAPVAEAVSTRVVTAFCEAGTSKCRATV